MCLQTVRTQARRRAQLSWFLIHEAEFAPCANLKFSTRQAPTVRRLLLSPRRFAILPRCEHRRGCAFTLNALSNIRDVDARVVYCKRAIMSQIAAGRHIWLHHDPGHRGVLGNEIADSCASSAATTVLLREVRSSMRSVRSRLFCLSRNMWHSAWQREGPYTTLYHWVPSVHNIPEWFPPHRLISCT